MARDLVRYIQDSRREQNCDYTAKIAVTIDTNAEDLITAIDENRDYIATETLADEILVGAAPDGAEQTIGDVAFRMKVTVQ